MTFQPTAPVLKGIVQSKTENPEKPFDKIGEASLWKFQPKEPTKTGEKPRPSFKGTITINGAQYKISLWDN